jgi:hypothetical protein
MTIDDNKPIVTDFKEYVLRDGETYQPRDSPCASCSLVNRHYEIIRLSMSP